MSISLARSSAEENSKLMWRNASMMESELIGKETVACAIDLGLVDPTCILKIKGIPHAQVVQMI
jgi:hypothetical protein